MGNEYPNSNYNYQIPVVYQNSAKPMIINVKKADFFKDEYVDGSITLQNQLPIVLTDIYLNLYLLECWSYQETSSQTSGEINKQPLLCVKVGIRKILKIDTELINLSAGIFNFPFRFKLPNYLQPSFEFPLPDHRGYLRYSLEAKFISPYVQGTTSIYIIVKARPKVLNSPLSFSSAMNIHKWGLFDQGTTILRVSYFTNNFKINESVPLKVEINNTRGKLKVTSCEVKVNRKVGYRKKNADLNQYELNNDINSKVFTVDVPPMAQKTYNFIMEIKDKDISNLNYKNVENPYPNLMDLSYAIPSLDGTIINCHYNILVTLFFNSFVTEGYLPKVTLPISLTHQSQEEYNYEKIEDEDLQKAIEASKLDIEKDKNKNNKNANLSCIDNNRMDEMIDKPDGYDINQMKPLSQSQLIDNDNNALPSKIEIENNPNNNNNYNNNIHMPNNEQNNNINLIKNNNINKNVININQDNIGNNVMNINSIQNCPAPAWVNKKTDDDEEIFNPYTNSKVSNDDNYNNKSNNYNNIQMSNLVNNNYSNSNYNNVNSNQKRMNDMNQINSNNNNIKYNQNNNNINQINNNLNNNYPNYNDNQIKNKNNVYQDFNNISNVNNINNENSPNKNKKEGFNTVKPENDFTLFNENNENNTENLDNEEKSQQKEDNYYNINEL